MAPPSISHRRAALALAAVLATAVVAHDAVPHEGVHDAIAQAGFSFTFDGDPAAPQRWRPTQWDVQRNVSDAYRQIGTEGAGSWMPPMLASHGPDCSPPPATHPISNVEDGVFICRNHVMTAMNAGYGAYYLTPNAMADFSAGEAVIRWDMSTQTTVGRDWVDVWITPYEENLTLPLQDWLPPYQGEPKRAIHLRLDGTGDAATTGAYFLGTVIRGHVAADLPNAGGKGFKALFTPSAERRDPFEVRISRTRVKVGMPTYNNWWIDAPINPPLDWDVGVVQFGHHAYNPDKGCMPGAQQLQDPPGSSFALVPHSSTRAAESVPPTRDVGVEEVVRVPGGAGRFDAVPMPSIGSEAERHRSTAVLGKGDSIQVRRVHAVADSTEMVNGQPGRDAAVPNGVGDSVSVRVPLVADAALRVAVRSDVSEPRPAGILAATPVSTSPEDSSVKLDGEGKLFTHYKVSTYGVTRPDASNIAVAPIIPDISPRQGVVSTCANTWHWDNVSISPSQQFTILPASPRLIDRLTSNQLLFPTQTPSGAALRFSGHGDALQISIDNGASWFDARRQPQERDADEHWSAYLTPISPGLTSVLVRGQASWSGAWAVQDAAIWATDAQQPPLPTPTPVTLPRTVTFDDAPGQNVALNGQYPGGLIDWGTNRWYLAAPWKRFATKSIGFNGGGITSAPFMILAPGHLDRLDAYNGGTASSTVTLACPGQPTVSVPLAPDQLVTIPTNWTGDCRSVAVGSTNGWSTNMDNVVIGGP